MLNAKTYSEIIKRLNKLLFMAVVSFISYSDSIGSDSDNPGDSLPQIIYPIDLPRRSDQERKITEIRHEKESSFNPLAEYEMVEVVAGPNYKASGFKKFLFGAHYRDAWTTGIRVPVIELQNTYGGLTPIKKGGGMQTSSLRLSAKDGHQYVFRSIQKDPTSVLPEELQHTFAADILQDQISTAHPYGAFVIPTLAEASGLFYNIPRLGVIPDDPNLKEYRSDFANLLVLFEQRPDDDLSDIGNYGYTRNAIGTDKLIKKVQEDNDVIVDEQELLRNRLFDMFIGDWDRHEDQWRWAEFKCKLDDDHSTCDHLPDNDTYYVPISRDRDQVFAKFDGVLPSIVSRKWLLRKFTHFDYDIRDIGGINYNARFLDRSFLTRLDKDQWIEIANELRDALSDTVIEEAIKEWPDEIYNLDGPEIISKLKSRRDKLPEFAVRYYTLLAKEVDVVGSNKHELFEVNRVNDEVTQITIYKIKQGEIRDVFYKREFYRSETKEIRLYGLGGQDRFVLHGDVNHSVLIRIIGGDGEDTFFDNSHVKGIKKFTIIYDEKSGNGYNSKGETKTFFLSEDDINEYDRGSFEYNLVAPNLYSGYNFDNGFFLGGGATFIKQGFRKKPYASYHRILANWAFKTNGFNVLFNAEYIDIARKADFIYDISIFKPRITNFFGYGNETELDNSLDDNYYEITYDEILINSFFAFGEKDKNQLKIGPKYQNVQVQNIPESLSESEETYILSENSNTRHYVGLELNYNFRKVDNEILPNRGYNLDIKGVYNQEVTGSNISNVILMSSISFYAPIIKRLTYAFNTTGITVFNDFEFYHAAQLGGPQPLKDNSLLRGYRRNRFTGRSSLAINQELRYKLFDFRTYVMPGSVGISAFYDLGRVWYDDENSKKWHNDFGGGIWVMPFNKALISANYAISDEGNLMSFVFGYLF